MAICINNLLIERGQKLVKHHPLPLPTSHLSPPTSHLPPPTSHLPPPSSIPPSLLRCQCIVCFLLGTTFGLSGPTDLPSTLPSEVPHRLGRVTCGWNISAMGSRWTIPKRISPKSAWPSRCGTLPRLHHRRTSRQSRWSSAATNGSGSSVGWWRTRPPAPTPTTAPLNSFCRPSIGFIRVTNFGMLL